MIVLRKAKYFKTVVVLLMILFLFQSNHLLCLGSSLQKQFEIAIDEYNKDEFEAVKKRLERLIISLDTKGVEERKLLAESYLLLGATYEKTGDITKAVTNYKIACKKWKKLNKLKSKKGIIEKAKSVPSIPGIKLDDLEYCQEYAIEKCSKIKFPWLLVVGGVVVVSLLVYFLFIKKPKTYDLTVTIGEGVDGSPGTGTQSYKKGKTVNYNYTLQSGYSDLIVLLDNNPAAASGTVTMNNNHTLDISTTKLVSVHIKSEPSEAEVYIDGVSKGISTSCDFLITPENHEIRLVKTGYGEAKKTINFQENKKHDIIVTLSGYTYEFMDKWGRYGNGTGQFSAPHGITIDKNNYLYITELENHRVQKLSSNGDFIFKWGSLGTGHGEFDHPLGIVSDKKDFVYVADSYNHRIQKFETTRGRFKGEFCKRGSKEEQLLRPAAVGLDDKNIYIVDKGNNRIQKFDSNFSFIRTWGAGGNGSGQFSNPVGIALDSNNYIYVVDKYNHRIQKFDSNGVFITKWGQEGDHNREFNSPCNIAVDKNDFLYITDAGQNRIQKLANNGNFVTKWGTKGGGDGQFNYPWGIAIDNDGFVYITDTWNHRIQKFKQSTTLTDGDGTWEINMTPASNRITQSSSSKNLSPLKTRNKSSAKKDAKGNK